MMMYIYIWTQVHIFSPKQTIFNSFFLLFRSFGKFKICWSLYMYIACIPLSGAAPVLMQDDGPCPRWGLADLPPPPPQTEPFWFFGPNSWERSEKNERWNKKNQIFFLDMIDFFHNFQVFWVQFSSKMMLTWKDWHCFDRS